MFLVDHAWTFEAEYAKNQLRTNPQLLVRMANLLEVVDPDSEGIFKLLKVVLLLQSLDMNYIKVCLLSFILLVHKFM